MGVCAVVVVGIAGVVDAIVAVCCFSEQVWPHLPAEALPERKTPTTTKTKTLGLVFLL